MAWKKIKRIHGFVENWINSTFTDNYKVGCKLLLLEEVGREQAPWFDVILPKVGDHYVLPFSKYDVPKHLETK